ncbi:unnamed protein product [Calypogeia fissa]
MSTAPNLRDHHSTTPEVAKWSKARQINPPTQISSPSLPASSTLSSQERKKNQTNIHQQEPEGRRGADDEAEEKDEEKDGERDEEEDGEEKRRRDARGMEERNAPPSAAAAALRLQGYTTIQESGKNNERMNDRSERYGGRRPRRRPAPSPTLLAHLETSFLLPMQRSNTNGQERRTHKRAKKKLSGVLRREREGEGDE